MRGAALWIMHNDSSSQELVGKRDTRKEEKLLRAGGWRLTVMRR